MSFDWLKSLRAGLQSPPSRRRRPTHDLESLEPRTLLSIDPVGPEFQVNTYTSLGQEAPAIAMDAAGNFVIVWQSDGQDGSLKGIYAQRYNASGVPQGSEFLVNTNTSRTQLKPAVAMDANGDFVITWTSFVTNFESDIFAQRYNAAGVPQGTEFKVNFHTNDSQYDSSIAMDADGDFVVTWTSSGEIYAQRFNAAGVPQGLEFRVNSYATEQQETPSIAMDADGDFVITWQSYMQDGSNDGIFAQRYNAAGVAQGTEFQVHSYTSGPQELPSIAMDAVGNFVITWSGPQLKSFSDAIFAQRFNAAGIPQGSEFRITPSTLEDGYKPSISADADGDFIVTWEVAGDVFARRYNAQGSPLGTKFLTNSNAAGTERNPSVSMDTDGDFVIVWNSSAQDGSGNGVYAQRYLNNQTNLPPSEITLSNDRISETSPVGTVIGTFTSIDANTGDDFTYALVGGSGSQDNDKLAIVGNELRLAKVLDFQTKSILSIRVKSTDSAGASLEKALTIMVTPIDAEFHVNTSILFWNAASSTAMDADGDFVVTWISHNNYVQFEDRIVAQRYDAAGTPQGPEFTIHSNTLYGYRPQAPAIAMDDDGDFVVSWIEWTPTGRFIYARCFNAEGVPQGSEFPVNSTTTNASNTFVREWFPSIAMDADGDFVITWLKEEEGSEEPYADYARCYNSLGVPQGTEFKVNSSPVGLDGDPRVAMDEDGDFVITWQKQNESEESYAIYAQRYNAAGLPQGTEFQVNNFTGEYEGDPSIAMDRDGNFVIAWNSNGKDGSSYGVYARLYNTVGEAQGNEFQVNTTTSHSEGNPKVAMDDSGNFVITWNSFEPVEYEVNIFAQKYTASGLSEGTEFQVNSYTTGLQDYQSIAMDVDGDFVITWTNRDENGSSGIYARRYQVGHPDQLAVKRSSSFYLDSNHSKTWNGGATDTLNSFGSTTDKPLAGDWNGDGYTDIGTWRNGTFYLDANGNGLWDGPSIDKTFKFGLNTDTPLVGDWNGDGKDDIGVWRAGKFYLDLDGNRIWNSAIDKAFTFGAATDTPIIGDWNADGKDDLGVWRSGKFYLDLNANRIWNSGVDGIFSFGLSTDTPIIGDWNADGIDDIAVWRNGKFYQDTNGNRAWNSATDTVTTFGSSTDTPLIGYWRPKSIPGSPPAASPLPPNTILSTPIPPVSTPTTQVSNTSVLATLIATPAKRRDLAL